MKVYVLVYYVVFCCKLLTHHRQRWILHTSFCLFYLMNQLLDQNNIGPIIYYNVTRIWNFDENSQFENK